MRIWGVPPAAGRLRTALADRGNYPNSYLRNLANDRTPRAVHSMRFSHIPPPSSTRHLAKTLENVFSQPIRHFKIIAYLVERFLHHGVVALLAEVVEILAREVDPLGAARYRLRHSFRLFN